MAERPTTERSTLTSPCEGCGQVFTVNRMWQVILGLNGDEIEFDTPYFCVTCYDSLTIVPRVALQH
jgi:hypothetical protein